MKRLIISIGAALAASTAIIGCASTDTTQKASVVARADAQDAQPTSTPTPTPTPAKSNRKPVRYRFICNPTGWDKSFKDGSQFALVVRPKQCALGMKGPLAAWVQMRDIHWSSWGKTATATAALRPHKIYDPVLTVKVALSKPRKCGDLKIYTKLTLTHEALVDGRAEITSHDVIARCKDVGMTYQGLISRDQLEQEAEQEGDVAEAEDGNLPDDDEADTMADDTEAAYYSNCTEARDAGAAPLYEGDDGYSTDLDRDQDGVACES